MRHDWKEGFLDYKALELSVLRIDAFGVKTDLGGGLMCIFIHEGNRVKKINCMLPRIAS